MVLTRNRADRHSTVSPIHNAYLVHHSLPSAHLQCAAKDHLLKWRPVLTISNLLAGKDLKKHYQLTTLTWEPSMLISYASGLLVFHTWGNSRGLSEVKHVPVLQDTLAGFITNLAGAYSGDTIANYIQGVRAWHRIYNILWNIDKLHILSFIMPALKLSCDLWVKDEVEMVPALKRSHGMGARLNWMWLCWALDCKGMCVRYRWAKRMPLLGCLIRAGSHLAVH